MNGAARTALALALAGILLAGCSTSLPQVSMSTDGVHTQVAPALWCRPDSRGEAQCQVDGGLALAGRLRIGVDAAVWVHVPAQVAAQPWLVVFATRTAGGQITESRTRIFDAGTRWLTQIKPTQPGEQLVRVEVQSGLRPVATPSGTGVDFAALQSWILLGS